MEVLLFFPTLRSQLWHARALDFLRGYSCSSLPQYLTNKENTVLGKYTNLHDSLRNLQDALDNPTFASPVVDKTKQTLSKILESTDAPQDAPTSATSQLKAAWEQVQKIIATYRKPNLDNMLNGISSLLQSLIPARQSRLAEVLVAVYHAVEGDRTTLHKQVRQICHSEPGESSQNNSINGAFAKF